MGDWARHGARSVENKFRRPRSALLVNRRAGGVALAALAGFIIMPIVGWRAVLIACGHRHPGAVYSSIDAAIPNEPARTVVATWA